MMVFSLNMIAITMLFLTCSSLDIKQRRRQTPNSKLSSVSVYRLFSSHISRSYDRGVYIFIFFHCNNFIQRTKLTSNCYFFLNNLIIYDFYAYSTGCQKQIKVFKNLHTFKTSVYYTLCLLEIYHLILQLMKEIC